MIVLDASLAIAWILDERPSSLAPAIYEVLPEVPIRVPAHWPVEVANALRNSLRKRDIPFSDLMTFLEGLDDFEIEIEPPVELDTIGPLANFAVLNDLTAYDASYVQLALRHSAILATLDQTMRAAAQRLGIALLPS